MTEKIIRPDFFQIPTLILDDDDMNTLDGFVYAVIYWYAKLKLEKCVASNETIARMVKSTKGAVANSISRLAKKKYIRVIMNSHTHHREEIIPMITFSNPSPADEAPLIHRLSPFIPELRDPSSTDEQNKNIKNNKIIYKDMDSKLSREPKVLKPSVDGEKKVYGNPDINAVIAYMLQRFELPRLDKSSKVNRQYASTLLKKSKTGLEGVFWLIDLAAQDPWFKHHITCVGDLWANQVKIVAGVRGKRREVAVYGVDS